MKAKYLCVASLLSMTLSGCGTPIYYHDPNIEPPRMTEYQATSRSVYPNPQYYNTQYHGAPRPYYRYNPPSAPNTEPAYETGQNSVKSSFNGAG